MARRPAQRPQGRDIAVGVGQQGRVISAMTIHVVMGVAADLVAGGDQPGRLICVGEPAHVAVTAEQAGAQVPGASHAMGFERPGPGVGGRSSAAQRLRRRRNRPSAAPVSRPAVPGSGTAAVT